MAEEKKDNDIVEPDKKKEIAAEKDESSDATDSTEKKEVEAAKEKGSDAKDSPDAKEVVEETKEVKLVEKPAPVVKKAPVKKKKAKPVVPEVHPLDVFGPVRKAFILNHIRTIEYQDLAKLIAVDVSELKDAVESAGIKLPIDRSRKWADLNVGTYRSLTDCARCPVQLEHVSFYVGLKKCDKCLEKNIKLWIESEIPIIFPFTR